LIKKLAQSISDEQKEFTGIPLQCRMLAEAFDEEVRMFYQSSASLPELKSKLDLLELYGRFIERKYAIYQKEKFKVPENNVIALEQKERDLKCMRVGHQLLALKVLFTEEQVTEFQNNIQCTFSTQELARAGIVQVSYEDKLHFIHQTFAEYYVADFLVNQLAEGSTTSQQVHDLLLKKIFLEKYYRMIRVFIDGLLSRTNPSQEVLKEYGHQMSNWEDGVPILHEAAREGNAHIIGFLFDIVQAGEHKDAVHELLIARDHYERTAWHLAAERGNTDLLETIWKLARQKLTTEEIRNKLLLGNIKGNKNAWQIAAGKGKVQVLEKLWEWAREELTPGELKNKLFMAKCLWGRTAWQDEAMRGNSDFLDKLWEWVKLEVTPDEFCKLLLSVDLKGTTVWHNTIEMGKAELLEKLWNWAKQKLTPGKLKYQVLLGKGGVKEDAWHMAAEGGYIELQDKLWEWANETLTSDELNNKLLLGKNNRKRTAWHLAAEQGNVELLEKLWRWAKNKLTPDKLKNELLFSKDRDKKTVWDMAAEQGNKEVFLKLHDWAADVLTPAEMINQSPFIQKRLNKLN
jgi:ankyrin repeat protein